MYTQDRNQDTTVNLYSEVSLARNKAGAGVSDPASHFPESQGPWQKPSTLGTLNTDLERQRALPKGILEPGLSRGAGYSLEPFWSERLLPAKQQPRLQVPTPEASTCPSMLKGQR